MEERGLGVLESGDSVEVPGPQGFWEDPVLGRLLCKLRVLLCRQPDDELEKHGGRS